MDFLVQMEITALFEDRDEELDKLLEQERQRAHELSAAGILQRLWRIPGRRANWGLWTAQSPDELHEAIASLPLFPYMTVTVHPLASHPNDPRRK